MTPTCLPIAAPSPPPPVHERHQIRACLSAPLQARGLLALQAGDAKAALPLLQRAVGLDARLAPVLSWKALREEYGGAAATQPGTGLGAGPCEEPAAVRGGEGGGLCERGA